MLDEPIHILNVAIKTDSDTDDDGLAASFREFTQSKVGLFNKAPSPPDCSRINYLLSQILYSWHCTFSPLQKALLFEHGIRRLTFLVAQKVRARIHISWSPCGFYSLLPCMLSVKQFWTACIKLCQMIFICNYHILWLIFVLPVSIEWNDTTVVIEIICIWNF